jgi:hypothetical protein
MKQIVFLICFLTAIGEALGCFPTGNATLGAYEKQIKASIGNQPTSIVDFDYLLPVCKPWPQKPGYDIVTKPYVYQITTDSERYLGMVAAIVDDRSGEVRAMIDDKRLMVIDAIEPSQVSIDTANYSIKPGALAFGVRIIRQNHSLAIPIREELMNMYVFEEAGLRKVINALLTNSRRGEGDGNCDYSGLETTSSLMVLNTTTNGYFDLREIINENRTESGKSRITCKPAKTIKRASYTLKFNGNSYEIPKQLQGDVD